jgi:hypothetical protein
VSFMLLGFSTLEAIFHHQQSKLNLGDNFEFRPLNLLDFQDIC